ncbi:hypothetical protein B0F90DRAFT_935284 [Multifurca ochricompacta]|uniref:Secreted protein n=1 Tax=Multifurca ochricompacta TaxID=376703 RepID=A0AAD4QR90_9AGAM|nr:hypothetical protein B0F90DRAFT_935284 [Multifurca ochricompacta]
MLSRAFFNVGGRICMLVLCFLTRMCNSSLNSPQARARLHNALSLLFLRVCIQGGALADPRVPTSTNSCISSPIEREEVDSMFFVFAQDVCPQLV